jgi:hypothetical protein
VRAWYAFVGLALLTFALTAFVGRVPLQVSAAVALPQASLHRAGVHLRLTAEAMAERRDYRAEVEALRSDLATTREAARRLELQVAELERLLAARRSQSPAAVLSAPVVARSAGGVADALTLASAPGRASSAGCRSPPPRGWSGWWWRSAAAPRSCARCSTRSRGSA